MAAQLGGAFELTSAPGKGTRADLYLPVAEMEARPVAPYALPPVATLRSVSLLLVDDEDLVRTGTAEMLRDLGHEVREASGGGQALAMLATGVSVDAVITDYMMPRMNGAQLASELGSRFPGLPILVVTGYAGGDLDLGLPQLAKPFRQADLALALSRLLQPADAPDLAFETT